LLNASALEVTFGRELDLNRELRAAGAGNLLAGLRGGFVGFLQLSASTLALGLKGASRWASLIATAICALFLVFGGQALHLFPTAILGGLVMLVGLGFLHEWLVLGWSRLPRQDYVIVVVIVLTTAVMGFLQAVILGLLIAIVLFAVSYSWADVIRAELNGAGYHSRVTRSRQQQTVLDQAADRLAIFQIQGFIFFGTAHTIGNRVRQRLNGNGRERPEYVILDLSQVTGLDSTAAISFRKLILEADRHDVCLIFAASGGAIWRQLLRSGLNELGDKFQVFPTLDTAVEWCEEQLLAASGLVEPDEAPALVEQLAHIQGSIKEVATMATYMDRLKIEPGQQIITKGDPAETMYFVESGRLTAQLARTDGPPLRLQSMDSGNVVGEIGFYLGGHRTADVVADEVSVVYRLSLSDLARMETEQPHIAAILHHLVATLLADRAAHLTAIVGGTGGDQQQQS
jgi:SulP family sulfate permease